MGIKSRKGKVLCIQDVYVKVMGLQLTFFHSNKILNSDPLLLTFVQEKGSLCISSCLTFPPVASVKPTF